MIKKVLGLICLLLISCLNIYAQLTDLMIVSYVDWDSGSGFAIKIYNPTSNTINLNSYYISRYADGELNASTQVQLSGSLASGTSKIYGNSAYCSNCSNGCNIIAIAGTNENDVIALTLGATNTFIDMVGAYGVDTELKIDGVNGAIYQNKLVRKTNNCTRYTDKAGTSINSWPDNPNDNVTSWTTFGVSCLSNNTESYGIQFTLGDDITICDNEVYNLNMNSLNADAYEWVNQNNFTSSINISEKGVYKLIVTKASCQTEDSIEVFTENCAPVIPPIHIDSIVYIPNIITPNGDNKNEKFILKGVISTYPISLKIFNRWGKLIYKNEDYKNDWDANNIPDGIYYYEIEDALTEYNGWLNVLR